MSVICTPASFVYLNINVLTATQGIKGCYGTKPAVSMCPSLDYF